MLADIEEKCGPVIDSYPSWHPLVSANEERFSPVTTPSERCGYSGLDHTVFFANGFVTCPYGDGQDVIDAVDKLPSNPAAAITAERLGDKLYNDNTAPILVACVWDKPLLPDGTIPKSLVIPLVLEEEVPCWHWSDYAESWETMRPYFLGTPFGSRSSLFVNQESGQALKKIWNALIYTGMFGPIKV